MINPTEATPAQPQSATQQQKAEIQRPAGNAMDSIDSRIQQAMEGDENRKHARQRSGTTAGMCSVPNLGAALTRSCSERRSPASRCAVSPEGDESSLSELLIMYE